MDEKRTRSRSGCLTCRKRKKRCDENRPVCASCARLRLECAYPDPAVQRKNKRRKGVEHDDLDVPAAHTAQIIPQVQISPTVAPTIEASLPAQVSPVDTVPGDPIMDASSIKDILSPMFRFDNHIEFSMPDFSLSGALIMEDPTSTSSMVTKLRKNFPLDETTERLFVHFCDTQSQLMSVSPQNHFKNVFAKLAVSNEPILYALLSWAAFHNGEAGEIDGSDSLGHMYLNKAVELVHSSEYPFPVKLASLELIASAHICAGDLLNWRSHLEIAAELIKSNLGEITGDEDIYWLLKNFTYHDILAYGNKPMLLPKELHDQILSYKCDVLPDSLCASCHPVFKLLANINDMYRDAHEGLVSTSQVQNKANLLLDQLDVAAPDRELLLPLSYMDARDQINLFRVFQQLARILVHNLLLKMNSACVPMQVMNDDMLETLKTVVNTKGEAALVFPHFIAGVTASDNLKRDQVISWLDAMHERHSARNIRRAKTLLREVWARDQQGVMYVDWNHLAEIKGWNLSFA